MDPILPPVWGVSMSIGRLSVLSMLCAVLVSGPLQAQEPASGEASTWTDPPARAAPQEPAPTVSPVTEPTRAEPKQTAPRRSPPVRENATPAKLDEATSEKPPAPTRAELRQEAIRRAVARSTAQREAEAAARSARSTRRSVVERAAPTRRLSERLVPRQQERRVSFARPVRRPVYGYADPVPLGPAYGRDEGRIMMRGSPVWQDEARFDARARRLAQARSAGYLVVRSRSYAYPDGTVVRRFSPLDGDDYDD